jgi:hypothetical protein
MKKILSLIFSLIISSLILHAEEPLKFTDIDPFELIAGLEEAKHADEDPNINASAATLESGPSAIVAGCVNAMTGSFFDSGIDLVMPGPQPIIVQHTFCNFLKCHYSHKPSLDVGLSDKDHYVQALYTDDNGSGIPYRSLLHNDEPINGVLHVTSEARKHLTNYSSNEISGRTRWANSHLDFVRGRDQKLYYLVLGSGIKRVFECYKRAGKDHQPGVPLGRFRLIEEKSPNRNKFLYSYKGESLLREVKAVNRNDAELARLKCHEGHLSTLQYRTGFSIGNMSVNYTRSLGPKLTFLIEPSHGIPTKYVHHGIFSFYKYQADRNTLKVHLEIGPEVNSFRVNTLYAPVGKTAELIPIYHFKYRHKDHFGYTDVRNALNFNTEYKYHCKYKRLYSKTVYDEEEKLYSKERFYWFQPHQTHHYHALENFQVKVPNPVRIHSEHLLRSHLLEGDGMRHFCRYFEYDHYGNITKNHLWGNLTGNNTQPVTLNDGIPVDNGCEVYTKTSEYSQDGLNLLLSEEDNRKWMRQTYYSKSNLVKMRLTGSDQKILKREFFQYDENSSLIEEIWDDGDSEDPDNLSGVTERHIRLTTPRTQFPIGLPEVVQEYYYDLGLQTNQPVKQIINQHSPEGRILSQQHYGSDGKPAYTLTWDYDHLGNVREETNALGEKITRKFDSLGNKYYEHGPNPDAHTTFKYDHANRLIEEAAVWANGQTFETIHSYNCLNQKIATIDPNKNETLFFYDRLGHLTKTIHPAIYQTDGKFIHPIDETRYNVMGQAIATKDANGNWTNRDYTIRGQVCKIRYPDGSSEQKEYSPDGLLIKETSKNGLMTCYKHDAFGHVILTEKFSPDGSLLSSTSATYNAFHLLSETDESGLVTVGVVA